MNKITIHRALSELKIIDDRINKAISNFLPTGIAQNEKKVNSLYNLEEFNNEVKKNYQSITDLIERKIKIKSAIVASNSKTEINVGDKKMTVADAITFKNIIVQKKQLIDRVSSVLKSSIASLNVNNEKVEKMALQLAGAALSKDNVKITDTDATAITEPFLKSNTYHLIDPLRAEELIKSLDNEVTDFETEIDAVLSESNAVTFIEI